MKPTPSEALQAKNRQIEKICKFFDREKVERIARETKFVQRESQLSGMDFFLLCVFAHQQCHDISLEGMCVELLKSGVDITKQSLQDRFNDYSVCFMEQILNEVMLIKLNIRSVATHPVFKRIMIGDSTSIELPESFCDKYKGSGGGASHGAMKLQYCYDLLSQKVVVLLVQDAIHPDNRQELHGVKQNDLRIEDLGYFKLQRLEQSMEKGAFFLSRYKFGVVVYELKDEQYQEIDLLKLQNKMSRGQRKTLEVCIGINEKLPVRMIIEKVPLQVAAEKRRRLKTDKQINRKSLSKNRLTLCNVNIYITNTTEEQLPSGEIRGYYSLRWQVEITFKAWKSIYRIDEVKQMKIQRFDCINYGALILIMITTHLLAFCKRNLYRSLELELSELKFFRIIKSMMQIFKQAVTRSKKWLLEFLNLVERMVHKTAIKQRKRNKSTPFYILKFLA